MSKGLSTGLGVEQTRGGRQTSAERERQRERSTDKEKKRWETRKRKQPVAEGRQFPLSPWSLDKPAPVGFCPHPTSHPNKDTVLGRARVLGLYKGSTAQGILQPREEALESGEGPARKQAFLGRL